MKFPVTDMGKTSDGKLEVKWIRGLVLDIFKFEMLIIYQTGDVELQYRNLEMKGALGAKDTNMGVTEALAVI